MHRRDFLKTVAIAAAAAGAARLVGGAAAPDAAAAVAAPAAAPELVIHGNPYAFAAGAHAAFDGEGYGFDPIAAHALPAEWRDRYLLGIEA